MKAWFQRFMSGRYGVDPFSQFLSTAALILVILGLFLPGPLRLLGWLGWAALIYSYYRIFSRNIPKRAAENRWFLAQRYAVQQRFASARTRFARAAASSCGCRAGAGAFRSPAPNAGPVLLKRAEPGRKG